MVLCLLFYQVEEIILPTDSNNQRRSFGFIQFDTERAADKASAARRIKVGRKLVSSKDFNSYALLIRSHRFLEIFSFIVTVNSKSISSTD